MAILILVLSENRSTLTLSAPNFGLHLSSALFLNNYRLERSLYVKLKD